MKKGKVTVKNTNLKNTLKNGAVMALTVAACTVPVFASSISNTGVSEFNQVVLFIAGWIAKLGMVVGFFGAVQCAFGFKNDDADAKVKGLRTMISGFIVFAIANEGTLSTLFGIK